VAWKIHQSPLVQREEVSVDQLRVHPENGRTYIEQATATLKGYVTAELESIELFAEHLGIRISIGASQTIADIPLAMHTSLILGFHQDIEQGIFATR
jgi:hypothetical protein